MDLISDLLPEVPSLLDPTNPLHNVTLLTNTFMGAFLGTFIVMKVILNIIGSCPPPASLTAILQTTVSPHSWQITKQLAVSARAVSWIFTILDFSTCQTSRVK